MSRRLAAWLLVVLVFAGLVALAASGSGGGGAASASSLSSMGKTFDGRFVQDAGNEQATVAMLDVSGTIVNGQGAANGSSTGGDDLVAALDAIDRDSGIKGVLLQLNTPGGAVLASAEVNAEIGRLRSHGKHVVAWMRDEAASGGYYIAAAADRIVAHPTTLTGSIGVIFEYADVRGLADKVGVKPIVVKSGKLKDIGSPFRDATPEELALLQRMIDEAYGDFVKVVSTGRHMPEATVRALADGRIYTGRQARQNGLVDELGDRAQAYDAIARLVHARDGAHIDVVDYSRHLSFLESLTASSQPTLSLGAAAQVALRLLGAAGTAGTADPAHVQASTPAAQAATQLRDPLPLLQYLAVL